MGKHDHPADHNDYDDYHNQAATPRRGLVVVASTRAGTGAVIARARAAVAREEASKIGRASCRERV